MTGTNVCAVQNVQGRVNLEMAVRVLTTLDLRVADRASVKSILSYAHRSAGSFFENAPAETPECHHWRNLSEQIEDAIETIDEAYRTIDETVAETRSAIADATK